MKKLKVKNRDYNILLAIRGEIDLRTKSESISKKKYTRKVKHSPNQIDYK